jgi:hypothetical protein
MYMMSEQMLVKENFPDDKQYTYGALLEELNLLERHLRDGSWRLCSCNPEKHLPLIAGLGSEGIGFTDDPDEKRFMERMMNQARIARAKFLRGGFNAEDAEQLRAWAREMRHRLTETNWSGEWSDLEEGQLRTLMVKNPVMAEAVTEVAGLQGGLQDLEERYVDEMLTRLAAKHNVPKPRYRFIEGCNPLTPQAWMVSSDLKFKSLKGEEIVVRPEHDELVFCRGQTAPYSVSHEFCHGLQRLREGMTDEKYATECGLAEVQSVETLNTLTLQEYSGGKMAKGKGQIIEQIKGTLPLMGGVLIGELIDESGMIEQAITPFTGTYTNLGKAVVGLAISGAGLAYFSGAVSDVMLGVGLPIAVSGIRNQFLGGVALGGARLRVPTMMEEYAYPRGLTPYAVPTGLRAGHPTLQVTKLGSRPGVLAPSALPTGLSGKFNLGNR